MKEVLNEWRKFLLKEESKYSQQLMDLVNQDQKLRNLFDIEMKKAGGWSPELLAKFIEKHGTSKDDVFGDKQNKTVEKFVALFPSLDFPNFSEQNWNDFNMLLIHLREPQYLRMRQKALSEMIKAKRWWRSLATDMARQAKMLPEFEGTKLEYGNGKKSVSGKIGDDEDGGRVDLALKKRKITWDQLAQKLLKI
mgnify:FL=1|jgi:hypothetical protein